MAAKKKSSASPRKPSRLGKKLSPAEKVAVGDIKQGIKHVERSIGEVQKGLRKAEKAITADAKARIRELRKEGRAQLTSLQAKRKQAAQLMKNLSAAAEDSWNEIRQSADQVLTDAKATGSNIADRLRAALDR